MKKKINNNKKQNKELYNTLEYKHGNLMTASAITCLVIFMILMLLSSAMKSYQSIAGAYFISDALSVVFLLIAVAMGILAVKKERSLWEYAVYAIVMSFGFLSITGVPFFIPAALSVNKVVLYIFNTNRVIKGLFALNIVYLIGTLIYHTIKSVPKKK